MGTRMTWAAAVLVAAGALLGLTVGPRADDKPADSPAEPWLTPYTGPTRTDIDATTLDGKVLCGYQGWFNTPGDGTTFGFTHWGQGLEKPDGGRFTVDMWPDLSEYDPKDLCDVPGLKMPDDSPARLYSAFRKGPVLLHCKWMRQYGIDGVFLSRFVGEAADPKRSVHVNTVLANVREGCHREGRVWALMLDLSMGRNATTATVMNDWKFLCDKVKVREDARYLHHQKKPVVLLWGLGFKDRPWSPEQARELIDFFKNDPRYGGVYLIGGIDPHWRTLKGDSRQDAAWAKVYRSFDAISPWDAGRYRDDESMDRIRKEVWEGDLAELKEPGIGYMPTAFPGFSWDNLRRAKPGSTAIPRKKGEFYWRQFAIFRQLGVRTVFVGMFDEVDEGTAIYKVANQTPVGKHFVTYEGQESDWYLKLTGTATRMIRGDIPLSEKIPEKLVSPAAEPWGAVINPDNSLSFSFLREDRPVFEVGLGGWGPQWAWVGIEAKQKADGKRLSVRAPFVVNKDKGEVINVQFEAWQPAARRMAFRYDLEADRDVPLTMLMAAVKFEAPASQGTLTLTHTEGQPTMIPLPVKGIRSTPATTQAEFAFDKGGTVAMKLDPPCPVTFDNGMRVVLASETFRKGKRTVTLTLTFPDDVAFYATQADLDKFSKTVAGPDWFAFQPAKEVVEGVIDVNSWLDRPAGKRGGVRMVKDGFAFEDGMPVKFWGTNLSYTASAPDKETADFTAARFAKYGVNAVRMHKFSYPTNQSGIGDPDDSTRMDPKGLDKLDYFSSKLKENGVYFGWSHTFGFHVGPGDAKRLLAYDEIAKNLKGNTYAFIHFAEDVQDLMIEMVVNLLKHKNPYTGKTYAEEPALCFIELQNEDDIFFYTSEKAFNACPTYKKRFQARFAAWLKERYGSQEKLQAAWEGALKADEKLADETIVPQLNPWFFGDDNLPKQKGGTRQRLLDTAAFLHDVQDRFYSRFVKAIRDAGYKGPLCGSPWQAPSMVPHYYNLESDYKVGFIDRHNYFEGKGPDMFASMLAKPGSGYFGSGLQQVRDRPFALSEWIHVYPNAYSAEGPAIVAAYGMGLQGWDASYEFQSQATRQVFGDIAGKFPWGVWEADVPTSLGQFPALARMIYRGDVKEGEVIATRRVRPAELAEGKFDFSDRVEQRGDVKTFGGTVPPESLAAGRIVVEFTDKAEASQLPDLDRFRKGSAIKSVTDQLSWDTSGQGFFTVNTAGTKAVVGFAKGQEQILGDVKMQLDSPFASVFLTALERGKDLSDGKRALLTVLARQCNTGFTYFAPDNRVLKNGGPPILLEPVKATVTIAGRPIEAVNVLDHDGRRTGRTLAVTDGRFTLDGAKDKAIYYEVVFR